MQTRAISTLFDIEELRIYDVSRAALERFREDMQSAIPGRIILCDDPKDAAQGDAVICVTQSKDRFLKEEWLSPETIVFPMGSYQECEDDVLLHADKIVVDHVEQTLHRGALSKLAAEGKITRESITCTIGELVAGRAELHRSAHRVPADRHGRDGHRLRERRVPARARAEAGPVLRLRREQRDGVVVFKKGGALFE